jgi:hypothetical protein
MAARAARIAAFEILVEFELRTSEMLALSPD